MNLFEQLLKYWSKVLGHPPCIQMECYLVQVRESPRVFLPMAVIDGRNMARLGSEEDLARQPSPLLSGLNGPDGQLFEFRMREPKRNTMGA
jgi:hypothetical protein